MGLGVKSWEGVFEGMLGPWLRWCDKKGNVIPTGLECAEQAKQEADQPHLRAEQAKQEADRANLRAEKMAERLRAMGIDPETI